MSRYFFKQDGRTFVVCATTADKAAEKFYKRES